jgi:anthranilate synthase/aminodeoxychorismate synthase-like glutamine amidotransferase
MILLVDNYDSFAHNLARYFARLGQETAVVRNDAIDSTEIKRMRPQAIVLSPGPCAPASAGCCVDVVRRFVDEIPILGVCLGHQAIAEALGGHVVRAARPMHGRASLIEHNGRGVFESLPSPLTVCRYHSLVVDPASLPEQLEATAFTNEGVVMAIAHRRRPVVGVQFHPESILTDGGYRMLANFLRLAGIAADEAPPSFDSELARPAAASRVLPGTPVTF